MEYQETILKILVEKIEAQESEIKYLKWQLENEKEQNEKLGKALEEKVIEELEMANEELKNKLVEPEIPNFLPERID